MTARQLVFPTALALAACATGGPPIYDRPPLYDAAVLDDPVLGRCVWSGRVSGSWVYQENDHIVAYLEAANRAEYRQAIPEAFAVPARPLVRVSVIDFYQMLNGPAYLEVQIAVLGVYEGEPGWFLLSVPVTDGDACAGGRWAFGYPKVVRRMTLERSAERYVGTLWAPGGRAPELTLTLDLGEPGGTARDVLRFVYPFPNLTLKDGRVLKFGGLRQPVDELERAAPSAWTVRLGRARLEFPRDPESLLHRLAVGPPLAAYWARLRASYSITPR